MVAYARVFSFGKLHGKTTVFGLAPSSKFLLTLLGCIRIRFNNDERICSNGAATSRFNEHWVEVYFHYLSSQIESKLPQIHEHLDIAIDVERIGTSTTL